MALSIKLLKSKWALGLTEWALFEEKLRAKKVGRRREKERILSLTAQSKLRDYS